MTPEGQTKRILKHLLAHANEEVPSVMLHRIGSGKEHGYCASLSRRISDIRDLGYDLKMCREETVNGQRRTFYRLTIVPQMELQL